MAHRIRRSLRRRCRTAATAWRDDGASTVCEIEGRADRLTDFAERFELAHRACQFVGSLVQFFKQPHVFDGDHRLVGEGFEQGDLLVREGTDFSGGELMTPTAHPLAATAWRVRCECQQLV